MGLQRQMLRSLICDCRGGGSDCHMKGQGSQGILARALDFVVSSEFEFWLYLSPALWPYTSHFYLSLFPYL